MTSTPPHSPVDLASGRYVTSRFLGRGAFGEVWEAVDTHLDMPVAVKLFSGNFHPDKVLLEARLHSRLSRHPNVVSIHNVVIEPPRPLVAMELCPNGSVDDRLKAGDVSLVEAMRWTRDMLAGLAHAHAMDVLHRDLKPSNLLILQDERVAITDFGVAEDSVRGEYVDPRVYPRHMAPEMGATGSSRQTDVWAAGCTWYRLLCGRYPFASAEEAAAGRVVPAHHVNPQVPLAVSRAVRTALETAPAARYPDAHRMHSAVNALRVVNSWSRVHDPATVQTWRSATSECDYLVRLVHRPKVGYEISAHRDRRTGAGFRKVRSSRPATLARAEQELRGWLVQVVEGRALA